MKGTFGFDPAQCSYGPAIQQILSEWVAIDWFAPPSTGVEDRAVRAFAEHHQRARVHQPELFPAELAIRLAWGGWPEFVELCERVVAQPSWDWKFQQLKQLSYRHSQARGWSMKEAVTDRGTLELDDLALDTRLDPNTLIFCFGDDVFWNHLGPTLDLPPSAADKAGWYLGYATMDLLECIEWQLAERHDRLDDNPFVPLLRCYASGFHAFSLGPAEVVLFGFR